MKRLLAIFVAALLITGCSTTGGREKQEQETRQVQPQSSPQSNRQIIDTPSESRNPASVPGLYRTCTYQAKRDDSRNSQPASAATNADLPLIDGAALSTTENGVRAVIHYRGDLTDNQSASVDIYSSAKQEHFITVTLIGTKVVAVSHGEGNTRRDDQREWLEPQIASVEKEWVEIALNAKLARYFGDQSYVVMRSPASTSQCHDGKNSDMSLPEKPASTSEAVSAGEPAAAVPNSAGAQGQQGQQGQGQQSVPSSSRQ